MNLFSIRTKTEKIGAVRKDERGKPATTDQEFSDQGLLKGYKDTKIIGFRIWYTSKNITGIQAIYRDSTEKQIEGAAYVSEASKSQSKEELFHLDSGDHVKEICGFLDKDEKYVQSLIITSQKGESKRVGNSTSESKLFKLDINEYEYPSILYGAIEKQYGISISLGMFLSVLFNK